MMRGSLSRLHTINFLTKFGGNNFYQFYRNMSDKPKVLVTRNDIPKDSIDLLRKSCDVTIWSKAETIPTPSLVENIKDKDALFCVLNDKITGQVLDKAPKLKVIGTMSVGYDHLDIEAIQKRNIRIGYTPNTLTDATAELTIALLLTTSRRIIEANNAAKIGEWKSWAPVWMCGPGLKDKTVGLVGFGRIAQQVGRILKSFNISKLIYFNRSERKNEADTIGAIRVDFDTLLKESDFVIVTCALTPETKGLFSTEAFKKMKSTAILINTSRGQVIDQDALVEALGNKQIYGAGLDVMYPEPLPLSSPLFKLSNCVILPHIGSAAIETRQEMALVTAQNILAGLNDKKMPAELLL